MFGATMGVCQSAKNAKKGHLKKESILHIPLTGTGEDFKNDNDFTATGSEWTSDQLQGSCLTHNQATDYLDGVSLFDISATWTIALWAKKTNSNMANQYVLSIGDDTTEYVMVSMGDGSSNNVKLEVKGDTTSTLNTLEPIVPNRWYQLLITGQNGDITLFVDGVQKYQQTTVFTANTPNITIGNHVATRTNGMIGKLSTVRAWNSKLTQEEITKLFDYDLANHPLTSDEDIISVYPFYKSYNDNWFSQNHLTLTGTVPLTDRMANFNGNAGNFLKRTMSTPDVYAILISINPAIDITKTTTKQQLIGFGASDVGVFVGQSDGSATDETLSIKSADGSVTYLTDDIPAGKCSILLFNWNSVESKYDIHVNFFKKTSTDGTSSAALISGGDRISFSESDAFNGKMSDVRIYNASLTQSEIDAIGIYPDAYYIFNNTLIDSANAYSNASLINGANLYYDSGRGDVVRTDGANDRVDIPLGDMGGKITVAMWIKPLEATAGNVNVIVDKAYTSHVSPHYEWNVYNDVSNNKAMLSIGTVNNESIDFIADSAFAAGTWVHIAFSLDFINSVGKTYLNGNFVDSNTLSVGSNYGFDTPLSLGGYTNVTNAVYNTECLFSDVRFYKDILEEVTIAQIYNQTS